MGRTVASGRWAEAEGRLLWTWKIASSFLNRPRRPDPAVRVPAARGGSKFIGITLTDWIFRVGGVAQLVRAAES